MKKMTLQIERFVPSPYLLHKKKGVSDVCEHGFVEYFYSKNDVRTGNLEFMVEGNADHLLVPSKIYLKIKAKLSGNAIRSAAGGSATAARTKVPISSGAHVSVINNILQSMFESVEVHVCGQPITKTDKHNAYTSYMQMVCNYNKEPYDTYFELSGWSKDNPEAMDDVSGDTNEGVKNRRAMFKGNDHEIELIGKIFSPLFFQEKVLPTQVSLRILLKKADDSFILMHEDGEFKLTLTDATLMVQKVAVVPSLREAYLKMMNEDHPIPYHLTTPSINYYTIEQSSSQFMRDDVFLGKVPRRVVIGLVETDAYHGNPKKNPFNFKHFGLSEIGLFKDGMPYPKPLLKLDIDNDKCAEAYHNFMTSVNADYSRMVPSVDLKSFKSGYTLFSYDMSPDQMGSVHPGSLLNINSNIRLELRFKEPLDKNITLLVYSETDHLMEIHRDRRVTVDF